MDSVITAQVNEITEDILQKFEKKLLNKIINTHYFYFLNNEKVKIVDKALQRLAENEDEAAALRLDIIREKVEEFAAPFDSNAALEGFVRFRLREYYSVLEAVVDDAAQEFLIEREYEEFIGLLRYFVDISESKLPLLYVVSDSAGYRFLDQNKVDITNECLADFLSPMEEVGSCISYGSSQGLRDGRSTVFVTESVNYDDMLISTLISLSPANIWWYSADVESEIATTVSKIFGEKVVFK